MSVAPVMPVVTGTKSARSLLVVVAEHVDALDELGLVAAPAGGGCGRLGGLPALAARTFSAAGSRWTRAWMGMVRALGLLRGGDLGGGGEAGAELVEIFAGELVEGDDDFEVLGLFGAGGGLAGGDAGGAEEGLVADFGDVAFEDAAGQGIDGDVGGLVRARR